MMKFTDISDYYDETLSEAEDAEWLRTEYWKRNHHIYKSVTDVVSIKSVIEFGCGSGLLAAALPADVDYLGLDKNPYFLAKARLRNPTGHVFLQKDVRDWIVPSYDLAMSWAFLKHFSLDEWPIILGNLLRVGRHALFNIQIGLVERDDGVNYHHTYTTMEQLERVVEMHGHRILRRVKMADAVTNDGYAFSEDAILTCRRELCTPID